MVTDSLGERLINALLTGVIVGFVVWLILIIVSALLPGVTINAMFWGTIIGILAAIGAFIRGRRV